MKKFFGFVLAVSVILLSGCFNPVFDNIEKEVKLTEGKVPGIINSIVRFSTAEKGYLVCSNGKSVFYKEYGTTRDSEEPTVWTECGTSVFSPLAYSYKDGEYTGQYILKTAADSNYVYVLTVEIRDNGDGETAPVSGGYHLYYADSCPQAGGSWEWKTVEGADAILAEASGENIVPVTVFSTNDVEVSNRKAYLRGEKNKLYSLGANVGEALDSASVKMGDGSVYAFVENENDKDKIVKSAISTDDGVLFFTTLASVKGNGCYFYACDDKESKKDSTYKNTDIMMKKDGAETPVKVYAPRSSNDKNIGKPVMSIAVTDDYLLFGCGDTTSSVTGDGGIYHISLGKINSDKFSAALKETDSFVTNADAALTHYYEVRSLIVEDPSKAESDACIFASVTFKSAGNSISVSYDNKGLWGYYPERGNWNRE